MTRLALLVAVAACAPAARPSAPPSRGYALVSTLEIVKPIDVAAMTDGDQDARLVAETEHTVTVEVRSYPLAEPPPVGTDPDWRAHDGADPKLQPYLAPGPTANWDGELRDELLDALHSSGIDPDRLDDRTLVERVSAWLFASGAFRHVDDFVAYDLVFAGGAARVNPALRASFDRQRGALTEADAIALGVLGKQMFRARVHGDCTSSAILETTVLRALGIPTRLVQTIPIVDGGDPVQRAQIAGLRVDRVREGIARATPTAGFANHMFVEVWVGGRWVALNYGRLGQPRFDRGFFGMMIRVATLRDWGESELGRAWGEYVAGVGPRLASSNPYRSLGLRDELSPGIDLHARAVTRIARVRTGDLPTEYAARLRDRGGFVLVTRDVDSSVREHPVELVLRASGYPDIVADVRGSIVGVSYDVDGYVAFPRQPLAAGASYRIEPRAPGWQIPPEARVAAW